MNSIHSKDIVNSFCPTPCELQGAPNGLLSHLNYGLKDIFDVVDCPTGFGSPAWLKSHLPAKAHAHVVQVLQKAGANLVGKTWCDELTYSLFGLNAHYGTPIKSAAPARVPGGSSNGSVAAVAAGIVDIERIDVIAGIDRVNPGERWGCADAGSGGGREAGGKGIEDGRD